MSLDTTLADPSLENLKHSISPEAIAYYSEGGSTGPRSREVCQIIRQVQDAQILQALLEHSKTLRAPHGKEFPIQRVQNAIIGRLDQLDVLTSQNG